MMRRGGETSLLPLRIFLPLKTIHTRHWRGLPADLQMVICYGLGGDEPSTGDGLALLFCVVVYGVEKVVG